MTLTARLLFSLDKHKQFYRTPTSQRQGHSVTVMDQDKNKTTLSLCLNTVKNKNIIQTTEMPSIPILPNINYFTFFISDSFNLAPFFPPFR